MGCIYSDFEGKCQCDVGDDDGYCCYEDDPDPFYGCEYYESDYVCTECGADLNVEECKCED